MARARKPVTVIPTPNAILKPVNIVRAAVGRALIRPLDKELRPDRNAIFQYAQQIAFPQLPGVKKVQFHSVKLPSGRCAIATKHQTQGSYIIAKNTSKWSVTVRKCHHKGRYVAPHDTYALRYDGPDHLATMAMFRSLH